MTCASCGSSPDAAMVRRARAVICHTCLWVEHSTDGPWTGVGVLCTISGKPVEQHIQSCAPSCPRKRHPDQTGMVRFMGMEWYGVPRFLRWVLAGRLTGTVPGCGCHARLKRLWLRFTAWVDTPPALRKR